MPEGTISIPTEQGADPTDADSLPNMEVRVSDDGESASVSVSDNEQQGGDSESPEAEDGLILGKFKSQDDLVTAYQELQKKLGQGGKKDEPAPSKETTTAKIEPKPTGEEVDAPKGIDLSALSQEIAEKGELTEDTLADLESKGISRQDAETYAEGLRAKAQGVIKAAQDAAGGELSEVLGWAQANLSPAEIEAYNTAVDTGNSATVQLLMRGIRSQYTEANGSKPSLRAGDTPSGESAVKPYGSMDEMVVDMGKPEYHSNPAFRAKVERRAAATDF